MKWSAIIIGVIAVVAGAILLLSKDTEQESHPEESRPQDELSSVRELPRPGAATSSRTSRGLPAPISPGASRVSGSRRESTSESMTQEGGVEEEPDRKSGGPRSLEEIRQSLSRAFDTAKTSQRLSPEIMEELRQLTEAEDEAGVAEFLRLEYRRSCDTVPQATAVIHALRQLATPEAKAVLLDIGLDPGANAYTLGSRAAEAYCDLATDNDELAQLLASKEPQTRDVTIQRMAGRPLGDKALAALQQQLGSSSWVTHNLVATAFATDTRAETTGLKVNALMSAAPACARLDKAEDVIPEYGLTSREMALTTYVGSLAAMPGSTTHLLRYRTSGDSLQRSLAVIALARQNTADVHDDVLEVARRSDDGFLRMMAVSAMDKIATDQDKSLLLELVSADSFRRPSGGHTDGEADWHYPVREAAKRVLAGMQ